MAKRGKPSAQDVATKPALAFVRSLPKPPAGMTQPERETWKTVVASPAGKFIDSSDHALLVEYCRLVAVADVLADQIHQFKPEWLTRDDGLDRFAQLVRLQNQNAGRVASLAGKLRLSPSARVHKETAGRVVDDNPDRPRPWDYQ